MAELGSLFVSIGSKFNAEGINSAVNKIDELSAKTENITKGFKVVGAALTSFAVGGVIAISNLVKEYAKQEEAEINLRQAMKQAGVYTQEAFNHNLDLATSLQKITIYGDEMIIGVQKQLTNFGIEGVMLDKLTKATLDLASAKGMDLRSAGDLVAKSVGSSTNALSRYGVVVEGDVGSTKRMQMAVDNISKLFGGSAVAEASSFTGQIKILGNRISDLKERIGLALMPTVNKLVEVIKSIVSWFENLDANTVKWIATLLLLTTAIAGILGPIFLLIGFLPQIAAGFVLVQAAMGPVTLIITAITIGITALGLAWANNWGGIQEKTKIAITFVVELVKFLWEIISNYFEMIGNTFVLIGKIISNPFKAKEYFEEWKTNVGSAINNVKEQYIKGIDAIKAKSTELKNAKIADAKATAEAQIDNAKKSNAEQLSVKKATLSEIKEATRISNEWLKKEVEKMVEEYEKAWRIAHEKEITMIKGVQSTFTSSFETLFVDLLTTTKSFEKIFIGFLDSIVKAFISAVASMMAKWLAFQLLTGIFGGGFLKMAGIKGFQSGIRNFAGGLAMVGEAGPELVTLPAGSNVHSAGETKNILNNMSSKSIALTVNVSGNNISNQMDVRYIAEKVSDIILDRVKNERNL